MSLTKKIATNTLIHALGKFSGSAIGLIIIGLLTRYLGTQGYGYYTTIFAYLFFFATIGDLGLYLITINELGHQGVDQKKVFSNIFTLRFLSGVVLMLIASGLIWFFPYPLIVKLGTLIIAISVFSQMIDQILVALFQEKMKTKYIALAEIAGKVIILLAAILVIKLDLGFIYVLWTVVIGLGFHFLIDFIFARKLLDFSLAFDKKIWQNILQKSWPVATYMIFSMIYFKADTIILSLYHPAQTVGIYGAPYKILEVLITFPAIFMGLVSPHLSKAFFQNNFANFKHIFQKAFDFLSIIVWPLIFGTIVLAKPIMNFIAGPEFTASTPVLRILIIATGIIFIAHLSTFAVVAINQQKRMMKYYILAAALAVILYFIFIPRYSYYAAAIITVLIEFFILVASWLMVKKTLGLTPLAQGDFVSFKNNLKSFFLSILMALILYLTGFNLFVNVLLGIIIYTGGLWVCGILKKELIFKQNKMED